MFHLPDYARQVFLVSPTRIDRYLGKLVYSITSHHVTGTFKYRVKDEIARENSVALHQRWGHSSQVAREKTGEDPREVLDLTAVAIVTNTAIKFAYRIEQDAQATLEKPAAAFKVDTSAITKQPQAEHSIALESHFIPAYTTLSTFHYFYAIKKLLTGSSIKIDCVDSCGNQRPSKVSEGYPAIDELIRSIKILFDTR
ncbi:uncharacterized protein BCR38DRAFT_415085 [Pseudomassariella vexata]|uniref:Uncharacterized protein n=1 Tax=Pseudomassariella vexata TaxID=1141098 RepID=A0A1Y2D781_9PEZI|nr:uncharacterized protein BCR38DRAFT_415085 [Pseudomassariella vexata]ORY55133.1 hypothetical protein BCR38DRAFT_415085 [Pseudomassariella vexata]